MSEKIVVPEDGLQVAVDAAWVHAHGTSVPQASPQMAAEIRESFRVFLNEFCRWLSENPIVPTDEQMCSMGKAWEASDIDGEGFFYAVEWQRRMFRAEPEVPEAIKDLLISTEGVQNGPPETIDQVVSRLNARTLEAYRRGLRDKA